eukprot:GHVO01048034.1.p1 GENE.GHVO01048034.1~~GHVO01048034.1.p1  ORF type:complete len:138 (+),score=21.92 GHVO01048034.1:82-495(+)
MWSRIHDYLHRHIRRPSLALSSSPATPPMHFCLDTNQPDDPINAQWMVLWNTVVNASSKPDKTEQERLSVFFETFPEMTYEGPSQFCISRAVQDMQPRLGSRRDMIHWLGMVENRCRFESGLRTRTIRYDGWRRGGR